MLREKRLKESGARGARGEGVGPGGSDISGFGGDYRVKMGAPSGNWAKGLKGPRSDVRHLDWMSG